MVAISAGDESQGLFKTQAALNWSGAWLGTSWCSARRCARAVHSTPRIDLQFAVTPEPGTSALLAFGLRAMGIVAKINFRRKKLGLKVDSPMERYVSGPRCSEQSDAAIDSRAAVQFSNLVRS